MLELADIRGYLQRLDLTEKRQLGKVTETYRKLVAEIFVDIVTHTPQFTGNLAQGWQIVFGPYSVESQEKYSDDAREWRFRAWSRGAYEPHQRGDNPAVQDVLSRELPKLEALRFNSKVRIVNNISYAEDVDAGEAPDGHEIRPENLYYGKVFMTSYAQVKYSQMKNLVRITT